MYDAEYSLRGICSCRACSRSSECRGEPIPVPPWRILSDYRSFSRLGARTTIPQPGASVYGSALHIPHAFAEDCAKERAFAPSPALQRRILSDYRSFSRLGARSSTVRIYSRGVMPSLERNWRERAGVCAKSRFAAEKFARFTDHSAALVRGRRRYAYIPAA